MTLTPTISQVIIRPVVAATGPRGAPGTGGHLNLDFASAELIAPLTIGYLPIDAKVFKVQLDILTPYDNDLSLSVGTDAEPSSIFTASAADCATVEAYHETMSLSASGMIKLFPYYITQPMTGSAVITIYYI